MLSVNAIYDGEKIRLLDEVDLKSPRRVIVTFLDDGVDDLPATELLKLSAASGALDFLNDPAEDVYTDADLKVRYK
jgi:hypothetical protein